MMRNTAIVKMISIAFLNLNLIFSSIHQRQLEKERPLFQLGNKDNVWCYSNAGFNFVMANPIYNFIKRSTTTSALVSTARELAVSKPKEVNN